ncbi:MAG: UDP-N-acetylglucosamine 1-carboxyvinyltransferase [Lachnospiraceae bacterium]
MSSIQMEGGFPLFGEVQIQGSKNATLPILAATVLIPGISVLDHVPQITDVYSMITLLENCGCIVVWEGHSVIVDASLVSVGRLPKEDVITMRSSIMLLGALIGRTGRIFLDYPGGCIIGNRPIDLHLMALRQLGVSITECHAGVLAQTEQLQGGTITLPFPSVGATENSILAAVTASGTTTILNAAREPEIVELCGFLHKAGACIQGAGTERIIIQGRTLQSMVHYRVSGDRIVAGTYLFSCVACTGEVKLMDAPIEQMSSVIQCAKQMGCTITRKDHNLTAIMERRCVPIPYLKTAVYPGFPTDLQSILMAVYSHADGIGVIEETIFENRFKIVKELQTMGAKITVLQNRATVTGHAHLHGTQVVAEELRGGAALVVAGLASTGITIVSNPYYIDRGYEDITRDLRALGARISKE